MPSHYCNIIANYTECFAIAHFNNKLPPDDFLFLEETLFLSYNNEWFIVGTGGPMSKYSKLKDDCLCGADQLITITKSEAIEWLHYRNFI